MYIQIFFDTYGEALKKAEAILYKKAFKKAGANQTQAAKLLGVSRGTFRTKMKQYNFNEHGWRTVFNEE